MKWNYHILGQHCNLFLKLWLEKWKFYFFFFFKPMVPSFKSWRILSRLTKCIMCCQNVSPKATFQSVSWIGRRWVTYSFVWQRTLFTNKLWLRWGKKNTITVGTRYNDLEGTEEFWSLNLNAVRSRI